MDNINYEENGDIAILQINRPNVLNALNRATLRELKVFLEHPPENIRAIILTGAGEKAFIAGADIKEMYHMSDRQIDEFCKLGQEVTNLLESTPLVTIAAINGYALGGGLEMALACDLLFAKLGSKLGLPEVQLGLIPGFGGTQRLTRVIGVHLAKEMMLSGKCLSAEEAFDLRLINRICEQETLISSAIEAAQSILKHPTSAVSRVKKAINLSQSVPLQAGLDIEKALFLASFATEECKEAMDAFINSRHEDKSCQS